MSDTPQQQTQADPAAGATAAVTPPWPRLVMVAAAVVLGGAVEYAIGQDRLWPAMLGAFFTGVLVLLADVLLAKAAAKLGSKARLVQGLLALAIAAGVGMYFRAERDRVFVDAFGLTPPSGVSQIDIEYMTARDSGKHQAFFRFSADRAALDRLLSARKFVEKQSKIREGKAAKAQRGLWSSTFKEYGDPLMDRWKNQLPTTDGYVYNWVGQETKTIGTQTTVLWDAASGRGFGVFMWP